VSLRFGDKAAPLSQVAGDVFDQYQASNPVELSWSDRRPIGVVNPANLYFSATNPRGWFGDTGIDVTTTAGLESFRSRLLDSADQAIGVLRGVNAQGCIVWDLEGLNHYATAGYLGAPDLATTLAPELEYRGLVDEYFKRFTDAGLRVGVTIRATELADNNGIITQVASPDPAQTLIRKARYAHDRWGATLFYIDSNVDPTTGELLPTSVMQTLYEALPDCLFIPEHSDTGYYAVSAPFLELRNGETSTPAQVLACNPNAFGVIYTTTEGGCDDAAIRDLLAQSVQRGDLLLFNAWYMNSAVTAVGDIYNAAASGNS
jgi:hypothetical protein